MNARTFSSFVKTAMALQADLETPPDYVMIKAAVAAKFPKLAAGNWSNALELGGLGVLAAPATASLAGHEMTQKHKDMAEVGGLGMLAAPYAHNIAAGRSAGYAGSRMGQTLTKAFGHG